MKDRKGKINYNSKITDRATKNEEIEKIDERSKASLKLFDSNEREGLFPLDPKHIAVLCKHLEAFGLREDVYEVQQFPIMYGISPKTFTAWYRFEEVKRSIAILKWHIASRRRLGALKREIDKEMVLRYAHIYDEEEREINAYHDERKIKEEQAKSKIVIMEKMPESDLVAPLNEEEEKQAPTQDAKRVGA